MAAKKMIVPPGGFAGLNQQTPATQALFGNAVRKKKTRRKTRRKKVARKRPAKRRTAKRKVARKKKPARLVKGSAAAKRHMAKLRKMRRS